MNADRHRRAGEAGTAALRRPAGHWPGGGCTSAPSPPGGSGSELPACLDDAIAACRAAGFDLVIVETPGIGQGDAAVVAHVDFSLYVMTPEFGAASQLEKIDMLDFAGRRRHQQVRAPGRRGRPPRRPPRSWPGAGSHPGARLEELPVFGTVASPLQRRRRHRPLPVPPGRPRPTRLAGRRRSAATGRRADVDPRARPSSRRDRDRYLADIADDGARLPPRQPTRRSAAARRRQQLVRGGRTARGRRARRGRHRRRGAAGEVERRRGAVAEPAATCSTAGPTRSPRTGPTRTPVRPCPARRCPAWLCPGTPTTASCCAGCARRTCPASSRTRPECSPSNGRARTRLACSPGEGDAFRTNRRFHLLAAGQPATRLSTAFDSVTLYGFDPDVRPDIYGKVGNSGVSIATLDDMKELYRGFDLCDPSTSVSMTINGPAPDDPRHVPQHRHRRPAGPRRAAFRAAADRGRGRRHPGPDPPPGSGHGAGRHPQGGPGPEHLHLLDRVLAAGHGRHAGVVHRATRCATSTRSRSPATTSPRRGPTPSPSWRSPSPTASPTWRPTWRGAWSIDDFAPNFSFFFSNGMDPEYTVIGRVARRIWAVAMRDRYGANARSQKLKYHIQTSGRSLHAQEMAFNDIRTTLQALCAIYDNANSLHTNAYDEAVTTPTAESVRRALAIQMIINQEWGLARNENPLQGSFVVEELTDLVEEAVLAELDRLSERGGVLGAMETGYQRGRIQDESMLYESKKHDGSLPIIGVNTFRNPAGDAVPDHLELARSTEEEKQSQLRRLADFHAAHAGERPAALGPAPAGRPRRRQRLRRAHGRRAGLQPGRDHRRPIRGGRALPAQRVVSPQGAAPHRRRSRSASSSEILEPVRRRMTGLSGPPNWSNRTPMPTTYELSHLAHPRGGGGAHHPRGGGRLRAAGPALLGRQGLGRHAAPGRQGLLAGAAAVPGHAHRHRAQPRRGHRVPGPDRRADGGPPGGRAASRTTSTPAGWSRRPGPQASRNRLQTVTLLRAIREHRFDAVFGGARRDEEKARAKERVFSFRDEFGQWDPRNQRPELWNLYNGCAPQGRAHPRLPALQLDGAGHLAVHPRRADRAALAVLRPPAAGVRARRHAAGRLAVS